MPEWLWHYMTPYRYIVRLTPLDPILREYFSWWTERTGVDPRIFGR
jgi:hypothetical protein